MPDTELQSDRHATCRLLSLIALEADDNEIELLAQTLEIIKKYDKKINS